MYSVELYLRVRLACHVEGLSQREAARRFGIARETVRKMLQHSEPPGYRRRARVKRPKLDSYTQAITIAMLVMLPYILNLRASPHGLITDTSSRWRKLLEG
jgi:transposase